MQKEEDKHIWAFCNWQQAVRCRFVPVLTCNFLPEFCSNRLEISLNKFISQTITQIRQSHKKVMSARFISRFRHFHLKLRHFPTETGTMLSVITTFCYTNWARWHAGTWRTTWSWFAFGSLLVTSAVEMQTLCGNPIQFSSTARSQTALGVRWPLVTASPFEMKHSSTLTSTCP